jgi:hypothetical protein
MFTLYTHYFNLWYSIVAAEVSVALHIRPQAHVAQIWSLKHVHPISEHTPLQNVDPISQNRVLFACACLRFGGALVCAAL